MSDAKLPHQCVFQTLLSSDFDAPAILRAVALYKSSSLSCPERVFLANAGAGSVQMLA